MRDINSTDSVESAHKVLFAVRPDLESWPGGDTVQVLQTAKHLRRLGVQVVISSSLTEDLAPFDFIHLWHLERVHENYVHLLRARQAEKPVALSPIYWPSDHRPLPHERLRAGRRHWWRQELKNVIRCLTAKSASERLAVTIALRAGWAFCRRELLNSVDVLLPNSNAEAEIIDRESDGGRRIEVVPNGVDREACEAALARPAPAQRAGILSVGHFDPRKNQLGLIKALAGTGITVTFIGTGRRLHQVYYWRCRHAAAGRHRFLRPRPPNEILDLMRSHEIHICPSRFETPGLVNLEAVAMGCGVVVPDCPPVREYLPTGVSYWRPEQRRFLLPAISRCIRARPSSPSMNDWTDTARRTQLAYS
jgi:glycosyltransferase involved in cell wall biosynthesis